MLIKCPNCGASISDTSKKCIKCGCDYKKEYSKSTTTDHKKKRIQKSFLFMISLFLCLCLVVFIWQQHTKKSSEENNVFYIRDQYDKSIKNIIKDDIEMNEYIDELRIVTFLVSERDYKAYKNTKEDKINITVTLNDNFNNFTLIKKSEAIININNSILNALKTSKKDTGYIPYFNNGFKYKDQIINFSEKIQIVYRVPSTTDRIFDSYIISEDYLSIKIDGTIYDIIWDESKTIIEEMKPKK